MQFFIVVFSPLSLEPPIDATLINQPANKANTLSVSYSLDRPLNVHMSLCLSADCLQALWIVVGGWTLLVLMQLSLTLSHAGYYVERDHASRCNGATGYDEARSRGEWLCMCAARIYGVLKITEGQLVDFYGLHHAQLRESVLRGFGRTGCYIVLVLCPSTLTSVLQRRSRSGVTGVRPVSQSYTVSGDRPTLCFYTLHVVVPVFKRCTFKSTPNCCKHQIYELRPLLFFSFNTTLTWGWSTPAY